MANELEQLVLSKAQKWLDGDYDEATKKQVRYLMDHDRKELTESFYKDLEFGTGGLRGIMGVGTNRMNVYTVGMATQGLANYLKKNFAGERIRVAIGHDSRNNSRMFAERVADIFASNGFTVFLFDKLRPTPELSFAIRELKCHSGVVVTASHNPKEYNGYKVYWSDGAQLPPQHAAAIAKELEHIDIFTGVTSMDFDEAVNKGLITMLGEDCDKRFMANVMSMVNDYETVKKVADDFKLVYTPFHGCGHKLVPEALTRLGIKHLLCVPEQMVIDGNFPTVVSPNPENPEGFYLAIDLAKKNDVDFILGTAGLYMNPAPTYKDILSVFAGQRPLAAPKKEGKNTKEISRSHKIIVSDNGLVTITGGKWTSYRLMAEDTVDKAIEVAKLPARKCVTKKLHIHGYRKNPDLTDHMYVYGSDEPKILELIKQQPELGEKLSPKYGYTYAEVLWAVREEMAMTVEDVLSRRVRLLFVDAREAMATAPKVAQLMAKELGRDQAWIDGQVKDFTELAKTYIFAGEAEA